jgi:hypothetical protein
MKPKRPEPHARARQQTPQQVLDALLELVQRKFYEGEVVQFAKDRRLLLQWVILWPAREWFTPKAVTVPAARYQEILSKVLIEAAAFQTGPIKYRPAWLARVIQSHFAMHGEEIYTEAKSARTLAEHALLTLGKVPVAGQDQAIEQLAAASRLLDRKKPARNSVAKPGKQLNLFGA